MKKLITASLLVVFTQSLFAESTMKFKCYKIVGDKTPFEVVLTGHNLSVYPTGCTDTSMCEADLYDMLSAEAQDYPQFTRFGSMGFKRSVYMNTQLLTTVSMNTSIIGYVENINEEPIPHSCEKIK